MWYLLQVYLLVIGAAFLPFLMLYLLVAVAQLGMTSVGDAVRAIKAIVTNPPRPFAQVLRLLTPPSHS